MIAWATLEDAVRAWVVAATGLAADRVYFADQDLPISEVAPRVSIRLGDLVPVGQDSVDHDYDPSRPAGEEIEITAKGMRTLAVDLQAFAPTTVGPGTTARSLLAAAQAHLSLPSVRTTLNSAGLGLLQQGTVQRVPQPRQAMQEDRSTLSVLFAVSQSVSERLGYIETVIPTYGGGPVFLMEGAEDVARLTTLERWARADQPSFPRLIDGPRGRPGVQFNRIGSDVTSGSARNVSHLRDRQTSIESVLRLVRGETTIACWFRREALVVLAGVASPAYRLFTIAGADGALLAASCFYGITYAPALGQLFLSTQTSSNVGGTGISPRGSLYTFTPPQDVWTHVAVTLRKNGSDVLPLEVGATADWYINGAATFSEVGVSGSGTGPRIPQWDLFPAPRYVSAVGAQWSNPFRQFVHGLDGSLADTVVYPRALSAAEIATLYTTGPFGLRV